MVTSLRKFHEHENTQQRCNRFHPSVFLEGVSSPRTPRSVGIAISFCELDWFLISRHYVAALIAYQRVNGPSNFHGIIVNVLLRDVQSVHSAGN